MALDLQMRKQFSTAIVWKQFILNLGWMFEETKFDCFVCGHCCYVVGFDSYK